MPLTFFASRLPRAAMRPWRATTSGDAQHRTRSLESRTRLQRVYSPEVIPGLLQTPDYATAVLTISLAAAGRPPSEVGAALAARLQRQHHWQEHRRRVEFLIGEQALYTHLGGIAAMEFQLMCLLGQIEVPPTDTTIAIVPLAAPFTPATNFVLYDDHRVEIETLTNGHSLTRPRDLGDYARAFARIRDHAVTGDSAAERVTDALAILKR